MTFAATSPRSGSTDRERHNLAGGVPQYAPGLFYHHEGLDHEQEKRLADLEHLADLARGNDPDCGGCHVAPDLDRDGNLRALRRVVFWIGEVAGVLAIFGTMWAALVYAYALGG